MMKNTRKTFVIGMVAFGLIAGLSSCLKTDTPQPVPLKTYISVMNLSVKVPSAEMYFNTEKVTQPLPPGSVFSAYSATTPGSFEVKFKKSGSDSLLATIPSLRYDSLKYYTLLTYSDQANTVKAVRIEDNFSVLTSDKAYFRFFNVSPDINSVDLYIQTAKVSPNRTLADNITNPALNLFTGNDPGSFQIIAKKAGTDSVVAQLSTTLTAANAYTFFLKGLAADSVGADKISLAVLRAAD